MMETPGPVPDPRARDLVCLVADKNMELTLRGLLPRSASLSIRDLSFDILVHPERDPGCCQKSDDLLRPLYRQYHHALVLLDHEGCGQETVPAPEIEKRIHQQLKSAGWGQRARAVVIEPELEAWVWSPSPHVDRALGWTGRDPDLRTWLRSEGHFEDRSPKASQPKEAIEKALRVAQKPRSSAIYRQIASEVSVKGCKDRSFRRLRKILRTWFPA